MEQVKTCILNLYMLLLEMLEQHLRRCTSQPSHWPTALISGSHSSQLSLVVYWAQVD